MGPPSRLRTRAGSSPASSPTAAPPPSTLPRLIEHGFQSGRRAGRPHDRAAGRDLRRSRGGSESRACRTSAARSHATGSSAWTRRPSFGRSGVTTRRQSRARRPPPATPAGAASARPSAARSLRTRQGAAAGSAHPGTAPSRRPAGAPSSSPPHSAHTVGSGGRVRPRLAAARSSTASRFWRSNRRDRSLLLGLRLTA